MNSQWSLSGKRAVITGATKGIGRAIADEFVSLGAEIFVVARSEGDVRELVDTYTRMGRIVFGIAADAATEEGRQEVIRACSQEWDCLDVLVNNVGANIRKPTVDYTLEELRKIMSTNLESAFEMSRLFHPMLKKSGCASIINISSVASTRVLRTSSAAYSMSKAALDQMTSYLAVEWAPDSIRVNAVHPWYIRTPLTEPLLSNPEVKARLEAHTPLGRLGEPGDVAPAVAFLAMPVSSYLTGVNIQIDGGFSKVGIL